MQVVATMPEVQAVAKGTNGSKKPTGGNFVPSDCTMIPVLQDVLKMRTSRSNIFNVGYHTCKHAKAGAVIRRVTQSGGRYLGSL